MGGSESRRLIAAAVGKPVELLRTNRKTGKTQRLAGTIARRMRRAVWCSKPPRGSRPCAARDCRRLSVSNRSPISRRGRPCRSGAERERLTRAGDAVVSGPRIRLGGGLHRDPIRRRQEHGPRRLGDAGQCQRRRISRRAHVQVVAGRVNRENGEVEPSMPAGPSWPSAGRAARPAISP